MPGADFDTVRGLVTMERVLNLFGFEPSSPSRVQWYGSWSLDDALAGRRHCSFSVNVAIGRCTCHRCHSHGNQLELWVAARKLALPSSRSGSLPLTRLWRPLDSCGDGIPSA